MFLSWFLNEGYEKRCVFGPKRIKTKSQYIYFSQSKITQFEGHLTMIRGPMYQTTAEN